MLVRRDVVEELPFPITIAGHVDHGKSTLLGRLIYDTGSLPPDKLEEVRLATASGTGDVDFAFVLDFLEEERRGGLTIDTSQTFFATPRRRYVIIDAPGHKEFIKNMLTGAAQALAALLVVDVAEGVRDQTHRHASILAFLGLRQVGVLVNKMDLAAFDRPQFEAVARDVRACLAQVGLEPRYVIPIAARSGATVAQRDERLSWYDGPTVLEALDGFQRPGAAGEAGLRFPVQDCYEREGRRVAVGRIEAGTLQRGQTLFAHPGGAATVLEAVVRWPDWDASPASCGECPALVLRDPDLARRGTVLTDQPHAPVRTTVRANLQWLGEGGAAPAQSFLLRSTTQESQATVSTVHRAFDAATPDQVRLDAAHVAQHDVAEVTLELAAPLLVDRFADVPETGRFVLEDRAGQVVAAGIAL